MSSLTPTPSTRPSTVVVHGASGSQGLPVVRALVAAGHTVRGLTRTPGQLADLEPRATPVAADLADPAALAVAYAGADAVVVQLPLVFDPSAVNQARHVLTALDAAGVSTVVANLGGPVPPHQVGVPYVDARVVLRDGVLGGSAAAATVRPVLAYAENLAIPASARMVLEGTLAYPLPAEVPVPWLATDDLAALVVDLVSGARALTNEDLSISGPQALGGHAAADAVAQGVGRPVVWETISPDDYREMLRPAIGDAAADGIAAMYASAASAPPLPDPTVPELGATTLATWAARQDWAARAR